MCGRCRKKKGGTENQALGCSRGGFSTKIHITVDGLGNPLRIHLTPGQRNDIAEAEALILGYKSEYVIGDKGYDSDNFIAVIEANGAIAVIPPKSHRVDQRDYDKHLYKEGHRVECFINKIKWYQQDKMVSPHLLSVREVSYPLFWISQLCLHSYMAPLKCQQNLKPKKKMSLSYRCFRDLERGKARKKGYYTFFPLYTLTRQGTLTGFGRDSGTRECWINCKRERENRGP